MTIWYCVDKIGSEIMFYYQPHRDGVKWREKIGGGFALKNGEIERITGRKIYWKDEPIKIIKP